MYLMLWDSGRLTTYTANCTFNLCGRDVLKHEELKKHIDSESPGALLSDEDLKPLEDQYLSHGEVNTSLNTTPEMPQRLTRIAIESGISPAP